MLRFLRNRRSLYSWALAGLTEVAVATSILLFCYSAVDKIHLPETLPGAWLLMLIFAVAGAWEAGDRGNKEQAGGRRSLAMVVGLLGSYALAYLVLPARLQTGLFSLNQAWAILPGAGYLWYQGTAIAAEGVDYGRLYTRFGWQVAVTVGGVLLCTATGAARDPRVTVALWWSIILLFAAGLLGLMAARETDLRQGQAATGDDAEAGRSQSPVVTIAVLALLVLTLGASSILGADRLAAGAATVIDMVSAAWNWLLAVVMLIFWRWLLLLSPLIERLVAWYVSRQQDKPPQQPGAGEDDLPTGQELAHTWDRLAQIMPYVQIITIIVIVVVAAILIYRLNARVKEKAPVEEEERESLGFWQSLLGDLKALFQREAAAPAVAGPAIEALAPGDPRLLLRRLQAWGAARESRPREPGETPNAYGSVLTELRPESEAQVAQVTAVYNQARYGGKPPAPDQVQQAAASMEALEREPSS